MVEADKEPVRRGPHARAEHRLLPPPPQVQMRAACSGMSVPQSRLHNFSLPSLSWGNQRLLRCAKVDPRVDAPFDARGGSSSGLDADFLDGRSALDERAKRLRTAAAVSPGSRHPAGDRKAEEQEERDVGKEEDERLDKFRDAMMAEVRKAFERILLPPPPPPRSSGLPPPGKQKGEKETSSPAEAASTVEAARPWNLRLRRAAACNAPATTAENGKARKSVPAPEKHSAPAPVKYSLRSDVGPPKEERPKFSPCLSKEEVEEDFFGMTGLRPPRRPKKRPRNVQKQLESLYPGFYLSEVTPDLYKITEDK